jgi:O-antigen/teichoic acid export membrane protein
MTTSVKKRAVRGAVWTIAGYGAGQILRFATNIVLTRLLDPEFFGLMAVVNTLRIGIELFSDLGIAQSIVNNKRGNEKDFLNTAWTIQIIRGLILWILCLLITYPIANFYEDKRLLLLIPIVGATSIFDGFSSTAIHTLHRRMELGKYTIFELVLQILIISTLILCCWLSPTIWALAIGGLTASIYKMIGSHFLIKGYSNRIAWDKEAVDDILSFGKWMFIASGLMFAAEQSDRLILGKLLSFKVLGIYTVAYTLANMPRDVIKNLSYRVIFPALSNQIEIPREILREKIIRVRKLMLLGFGAGLAILVTIGDLIIQILYDNRYDQAIWMMPILCVGIWFSVLFYTTNPALIAIGKPLYAAQSNLGRFLMISLGLPLAYHFYGTIGAITVIGFSDFPLYIVNLYGLSKEKLSCVVQDIQTTAAFIGFLALLLIIRHYLGFGLPIQSIL